MTCTLYIEMGIIGSLTFLGSRIPRQQLDEFKSQMISYHYAKMRRLPGMENPINPDNKSLTRQEQGKEPIHSPTTIYETTCTCIHVYTLLEVSYAPTYKPN